MKVSIIGGGGRVGSNAAFALQCGAAIHEIVLIDANQDAAEGEALDLLHGASVTGGQCISAGNYGDAADADIHIITAGSRRKPDESRLDLINRNVEIFLQILSDIKTAGLKEDAIVFVVSNPVDVLTELAVRGLDHCPDKVIGLGTQLDTSRFRSLIADTLSVAATQVKALILGEHGDSMVPIWSSATVAGLAMDKLPQVNAGWQNTIFKRTQGSGAEVIRRKGGAGYAVGLAIREVVHAIALDQRLILPVSSHLRGPYNIHDVAFSVPTVVGREGVVDRIELDLWPKELSGLRASAAQLQQTLKQVSG